MTDKREDLVERVLRAWDFAAVLTPSLRARAEEAVDALQGKCLDPSHAEPFACHCQAEGGWLCEGFDDAQKWRAAAEQQARIIRASISNGTIPDGIGSIYRELTS